jgi:hypothetical protein
MLARLAPLFRYLCRTVVGRCNVELQIIDIRMVPQLYEQVIKSQPRRGICYHEFDCLCSNSEERARQLPTGGRRRRRIHGCSCMHAYTSSLQERTPDAQQSLRHGSRTSYRTKIDGSRTSYRTKVDAASTYVLAAPTHFGYMSGT